ncbi:MAG: DNA-processing protein DprA [Alphaproteobacteria bacterium]|nr:DNA-processing protein DprA [Alphaproteobacteria bacterium]
MVLTKQEKLARLRILRSGSVGPATFWDILQAYGNGIAALEVIPILSKSSLKKVELCSEEEVLRELKELKNFGARMVFLEDELYPPLLRNIPDPPPILTFFGDREKVLQFYKKTMIAIVGSRNSSIHANKFCKDIAGELGNNDAVVVSGLAKGIDTCAHKGSLESGTIAVLAGGIDVIYPQENVELYKEISQKGGIFTEAPFGFLPQPQLFPRRNRIIAGMTYGTLVVEAAVNSGSLITAKFALEYNREVFAVPGFPSDPRSVGCNSLLKDGATLVQSFQDILDVIEERKIINQSVLFEKGPEFIANISKQDLEKIKDTILKSLSLVPITIDELISSIKVSPREVLTALLELELSGKVTRVYGQRVCLTS